MKVSYNWIQSHIEEKLPQPDSLKETIIFHAFEVEESEQVADDTVFDIKVLPDRSGDCLSHYGVAREIAGLLKLTLKPIATNEIASGDIGISVDVQTTQCRRYVAVRIDGVSVGDSPLWLKDRLETVGQRSINNIVDATNFVMFDSGQPIHAFDAKKIDGGIVIRNAKEGESIITLSEEQKTLKESDMVIADYVGAIAIAGVKGGKTAEVDSTTTSIILEIGNFDPTSVRKTSRRLGLVTDASKRFENNYSPVFALDAAAQVVGLIQSIAGGTVVGISDYYPNPVSNRTVSFSTSDITRILGTSITTDTIANVFDQYRYTYTHEGEMFSLTVPLWRADIIGAHDIAEEIGRCIGYDLIPASPLPITLSPEKNEIYEKIRSVKIYLISEGFSEVMNYSFRKKGDLYIAYGPKDKSALRTNLSDGLKESYELNRLNAPLLGIKNVKLFEIGTVFSADKESITVATVDNGTVQELPLEEFYLQHRDAIAAISEKTTQYLHIPFTPWSLYPFIVRDVAVWVEDMKAEERLREIAASFAKEFCVRDAYKIDAFTKDGRTSIAYRFVFQAYDRTLTDTEVLVWWKELIHRIEQEKTLEIR